MSNSVVTERDDWKGADPIPGDLVTAHPRCAHVYYAYEHSQAVELADEPYDPADTYPYELGTG
ncbi:hypothetical protein [Micromonospora sp. NPDC005367]|uniref:hypothetical protein n=1 Tax=Micromonospora sp. NPDC005367 TaxID=3155590 RepID=UPI0033AB17F8